MRTQKHSIRRLHLRNLGKGKDKETLGSLKDCHRLHDLHAPLHALIDLSFKNTNLYQQLPPALKSLLTFIEPSQLKLEHCARALTPLAYLSIWDFKCVLPKGSPHRQLRLSDALAVLRVPELLC